MVTELVAAVAVFGALIGAAANSTRAYLQSPESEKFSPRLFFGSLLAAMIPALAGISFGTLAGIAGANGLIGLFIMTAFSGTGASMVVSAAHKPAKTTTTPASA